MIICNNNNNNNNQGDGGLSRVTGVRGQKEEKEEKEEKEAKFLRAGGRADRPTKGSTRGPHGPKYLSISDFASGCFAFQRNGEGRLFYGASTWQWSQVRGRIS